MEKTLQEKIGELHKRSKENDIAIRELGIEITKKESEREERINKNKEIEITIGHYKDAIKRHERRGGIKYKSGPLAVGTLELIKE